MTGRHDDHTEKADIWSRLAAPLSARAYDPDAMRARLDEVVPGEWDVTFEALPSLTYGPAAQPTKLEACVKCRLQVLGVIRESTNSPTGATTYKGAYDSAFMNACRMFGVGVARDG